MMEALAKVRSSPSHAPSPACFSTDRSLVCLFEPTKRSAMHEIARASFPPTFSLCGGWLGGARRRRALCVKVLLRAPLRGTLGFPTKGDVKIGNFLQNPDVLLALLVPLGSRSRSFAGQRKPRRAVTFNPSQPFPHIIESPICCGSLPSPLTWRHLFHGDVALGPAQLSVIVAGPRSPLTAPAAVGTGCCCVLSLRLLSPEL